MIRSESKPKEEGEQLDPIYRMPATLGRAPGPRNLPHDKRHLRFEGDVHMVSVTARTTKNALEAILPERCEILDEPTIEVVLFSQKNLGWLAGRGYNYLLVRTPVVYSGEHERLQANFVPVLWENMADPVLTGREELGMPKLFANISDPLRVGERLCVTAEWEGFRFFELELSNLIEGGALPAAKPALLHYHMPRIGEWQQTELQQMICSVPGSAPAPTIVEHRVGTGRFTFHPACWEDMPTQYTYIRTLASLPLLEFVGSRSIVSKGIGDLMAYRVIR